MMTWNMMSFIGVPEASYTVELQSRLNWPTSATSFLGNVTRNNAQQVSIKSCWRSVFVFCDHITYNMCHCDPQLLVSTVTVTISLTCCLILSCHLWCMTSYEMFVDTSSLLEKDAPIGHEINVKAWKTHAMHILYVSSCFSFFFHFPSVSLDRSASVSKDTGIGTDKASSAPDGFNPDRTDLITGDPRNIWRFHSWIWRMLLSWSAVCFFPRSGAEQKRSGAQWTAGGWAGGACRTG